MSLEPWIRAGQVVTVDDDSVVADSKHPRLYARQVLTIHEVRVHHRHPGCVSVSLHEHGGKFWYSASRFRPTRYSGTTNFHKLYRVSEADRADS